MSFSKMGKTLPKHPDENTIAKMVEAALRSAHQEDSSAVKRIARMTDTNMHTVKKWYAGKHAPIASQLLVLAAHYPEILEGILEIVNHLRSSQNIRHSDHRHRVGNEAADFNHRQLWFMSKLKRGTHLRAQDIATYWNVSQRTAERDIAGLVRNGMAQYKGAPRSGHYETL